MLTYFLPILIFGKNQRFKCNITRKNNKNESQNRTSPVVFEKIVIKIQNWVLTGRFFRFAVIIYKMFKTSVKFFTEYNFEKIIVDKNLIKFVKKTFYQKPNTIKIIQKIFH